MYEAWALRAPDLQYTIISESLHGNILPNSESVSYPVGGSTGYCASSIKIQFAVDAYIEGKWQQVAEGKTVGYKRISRIPTVTSDKVRIRILDSRVCPTISNFGLFYGSDIQ